MVYSRGTPGPVKEWDMPEGVYGCGHHLGWAYTLVKDNSRNYVGFGRMGTWIYPTEKGALTAAQAHIKHLKSLASQRRRKSAPPPPA